MGVSPRLVRRAVAKARDALGRHTAPIAAAGRCRGSSVRRSPASTPHRPDGGDVDTDCPGQAVAIPASPYPSHRLLRGGSQPPRAEPCERSCPGTSCAEGRGRNRWSASKCSRERAGQAEWPSVHHARAEPPRALRRDAWRLRYHLASQRGDSPTSPGVAQGGLLARASRHARAARNPSNAARLRSRDHAARRASPITFTEILPCPRLAQRNLPLTRRRPQCVRAAERLWTRRRHRHARRVTALNMILAVSERDPLPKRRQRLVKRRLRAAKLMP